jgi:hypothetical protein
MQPMTERLFATRRGLFAITAAALAAAALAPVHPVRTGLRRGRAPTDHG